MEVTVLQSILDKHALWCKSAEGGARADLSRANLSGADLYRADLSRADLSDANLSRANLYRADLSGADLSGANLSGANLYRADLSGADLSDANLSRANLYRADLSGADLSGANLSRANLYRANLSGANLSGADLSDANLSRADLSDANLPAITSMPDIRQKVLAAVTAEGCSLNMRSWHICNTTHCLGGWIVTIHPQGRLLESFASIGTGTAAALILHASGEKIPNFFDTSDGSSERAMNWLRTGSQTDPVPAA